MYLVHYVLLKFKTLEKNPCVYVFYVTYMIEGIQRSALDPAEGQLLSHDPGLTIDYSLMLHLKGWFTQKWKLAHDLLTLKSSSTHPQDFVYDILL